MYCNTLVRIAGCRRQNCVAIQNGIATERQGAGQGRWGAQVGVQGAQQACRRLGERVLGRTAQAGHAQGVQAAGGRWAQGAAARGARAARRWARGRTHG